MIGGMQTQYILKRTEILVIIANSDEYDGFVQCLEDRNLKNKISFDLNNFEICAAKIKDYHICYFKMNGTGPNHTSRVLNVIADSFPNLKYIVNLGCCATSSNVVKEEVIFADRIFDADLRKEKDGKTQFSICENKHQTFSNLIRTKIDDVKSFYSIKYEPLIASSAVVKDKKIKEKYLRTYPCAAGIEMEGIAVSNYALSRGIEWVVIKGTSDDAIIKNGGSGQSKASYNSTDLFLKMLDLGAFEKEKVRVFIGGAINKTAKLKESKVVEKNCYSLATALLNKNYKIINGLGFVVGNSIVSAVYAYKRDCESGIFNNYMEVFPFPRVVDKRKKNTVEQFYSLNRNTMITQCIFSIFVYGRNTKPNKKNGLNEEFDFAGSHFVPRIVIPSDNYLSKRLYRTIIETNFEGISSEKYRSIYKTLSSKKAFIENVNVAIELLEILDDYYFGMLSR